MKIIQNLFNKIMNYFDEYYSRDERAEIKKLGKELDIRIQLANKLILIHEEDLFKIKELESKIKELKDKLILKKETHELESYWDNKWKKSSVTYRAQGFRRDVRNMILTKSFILQYQANKFKKNSNDEKALNILRFVKNNIHYTSDIKTHKMPEFWQNPEETWQTKVGDCEDGALLIISLMRMAGVPAFRVKLCAGNVLQGTATIGHAYVIYLSEKNNKWYVLDWCFYPFESIEAFNKIPHKEMKHYLGIWWTVNDKYAWAQHSTEIK